jgi:tRNA (guanine-N7-)-methyltransferase
VGEVSTRQVWPIIFPNKTLLELISRDPEFGRKGSTVAVENNLSNVAFLRTQIESIENFFEEGEVNEIWVTFPDPRPKEKEEGKRLTSPRFLNLYKKILAKDGIFHLKTDNDALFEYSLEVLKKPEFNIQNLEFTTDLYHSDFVEGHYGLKTTYEKKYLQVGKNINYLKFQFP